MHTRVVDQLRSPLTKNDLRLEEAEVEAGEVRKGKLVDEETAESFDIIEFIPRFVSDSSYAQSFGDQWNLYRRTQIDRFNGTSLTRDRFFRDTGWSRDDLKGQRILEAGCGAGRFTQVLLDTGAEVFSVDYSSAVDACWSNNGPHPSLVLCQADLYRLPFKENFFDKVFCYGVLQHTPDVRKAFLSLLPFLKPGGQIAIDVYRKMPRTTRWTSKFWYRPITTRLSRRTMRKIIEWYVPRWIPVDNFFQRIPIARTVVPAIVPCWNYTGDLPLPPDQVTQWAILDTFDALTPTYDSPQTVESVTSWFVDAELEEVTVRAGGNGILGNARKSPGAHQ